MPALDIKEALHAYSKFYEIFKPFLAINNEDDYALALELVEQVMTTMEDSLDDPNGPLLNLMADAIDRYENSLEEVQGYMKELEELDSGGSTLRLL